MFIGSSAVSRSLTVQALRCGREADTLGGTARGGCMIQVQGQDRSSPPRCLAFCSYHHLSDRSQALKTPVPTSSHILTISQLKPPALHFWFHSEAEPVADSWLQTASHFQPAVSPEDPTGSHSSCGPSRLSLSLGDPGWDQLGAVGTLLWAHARGSDHPTCLVVRAFRRRSSHTSHRAQ